MGSSPSSVEFKMPRGELLALVLALAVAAVHAETAFLLHTRRTGDSPESVEPEVEALVRSSFYAADSTVVSIPRWQGNSSSPELAAVVSARLAQQASNVISVDLEKATNEAEVVESVASLVSTLSVNFDVPLERILLVGFAEGAHLAGGVAAKLHRDLGRQVQHITALDPTPQDSLEHGLTPSDAEFVEVVHTNAGRTGTWDRMGHVDYFPNGGQTQPGCAGDSCSHERAFELLAEMWSQDNDFVSALCGSVETMSAASCRWSNLRMGQKAQGQPPGIYFLETHQSPPYGRGAYHIGFL